MNNDLNLWIEQERKKLQFTNDSSFPIQSAIYNQLVISNEINLKILETINKTNISIPFETFEFNDASKKDLTATGAVVPRTIDKLMEDVKFL